MNRFDAFSSVTTDLQRPGDPLTDEIDDGDSSTGSRIDGDRIDGTVQEEGIDQDESAPAE